MPKKAAVSTKQKAACIRYLTNQPTLDASNITAIVKAFGSTSDTSTRALIESVKGLEVRLSVVTLTTAANHFNGTHASPPVRMLSWPTRAVDSVAAPVALGVPDVVGATRAGDPRCLLFFSFFLPFF